MLRRHPDIFMPDYKEPRYFLSDLPSLYIERKGGAAPLTVEDYLDLFDPASPGQLLGEASTAYIWSKTSAELIAAARPDARIIVILREPASFVRSLHLQLLQIRVEKEKNLRDALALEDERRQGRSVPQEIGRWPQVLLYTDRVRYVEQLRRYEDLFPREQMLVLIYDDFRADNEGTVREVLRFLDVNGSVPVQVTEANPTVRMRSVKLDEAVRAVSAGSSPVARAVRSSVKALTPRSVRRGAHSAIRSKVVFGAPRPPDEALMRELRLRFKGEVEALSEYMDRDLVSLWGYDDLD